jgi:hypothetical protein
LLGRADEGVRPYVVRGGLLLCGWLRGLGEGEGDVDSSRTGLRVFTAAGGYDHVLASIYFVGGWGGVPGERKRRLPQEFASRFVEGPKFLVEVGGSDKE